MAQQQDIVDVSLRLESMTLGETNTVLSSAMIQVLATYELLKCIVSHLPCRDAISGRNVCTAWRDTIASSPLLQKGTFLRATAAPLKLTGLWIESDGEDTEEALKFWKEERTSVAKFTTLEIPVGRNFTPAILSSCLTRDGSHVLNPLIHEILRFYNAYYRNSYYSMAKTLGKHYPDQAWTRMLVTQPPTTRIIFAAPNVEQRLSDRFLVFHKQRGNGPLPFIDENLVGVTIADFVEGVRQSQHAHEDYIDLKRFPKYAGVFETVIMSKMRRRQNNIQSSCLNNEGWTRTVLTTREREGGAPVDTVSVRANMQVPGTLMTCRESGLSNVAGGARRYGNERHVPNEASLRDLKQRRIRRLPSKYQFSDAQHSDSRDTCQ